MASPIEVALTAAILRHRAESQIVYVHDENSHRYQPSTGDLGPIDAAREILVEVHGDDEAEDADVNAAIELHRGVAIASYRADILLVRDAWRRLVIECDGHEFHDRTKQQAAYDRARDRELLCLGFVTIRFTGSEIVHDVDRCADEVWRCLAALHDIDTRTTDSWRHGYEVGHRRALERAGLVPRTEEPW